MTSLEIFMQLGCRVTSQHRKGLCYLRLQVEGLQQDGPCAVMGYNARLGERPLVPSEEPGCREQVPMWAVMAQQ